MTGFLHPAPWNDAIGLGIMSGTSMDGIDMALTHYTFTDKWSFQLLNTAFVPWPAAIRESFSRAFNWTAEELLSQEVKVARYLADQVKEHFLQSDSRPQYIGCHGQTVFHQPLAGFSRQIGDGECLAAWTGLPVVSNFRQKNIALGGQGAPLVPAGEQALFFGYDGFVNLGGIANISVGLDAADVCFCNLLLDRLARHLPDHPDFDRDGNAAASGVIRNSLLQDLHQLRKSTPTHQSLSQEVFNEKYLHSVMDDSVIPVVDKLATVCRFVAESIHSHFVHQTRIAPPYRVLVTGGGARNRTIIKELKLLSKHSRIPIQWESPDSSAIIDMKEAIIFGWLALCTLLGHPNSYPESTGAHYPICGGSIHLPAEGGYILIPSNGVRI